MGRGAAGILFDMDGVLYNGETPIAGAAASIAWVRARNIPFLFVTNTTSRSRAALVRKLEQFGIAACESEILTPCVAAAHWLREQPPGAVALFVRAAAREEFAGFPLLSPEAESGARYVIIGDLGDGWDYRTLNRAFRLLQSQTDSQLIALGMTRYWQTDEGLALDVAPFVVALEHATGRLALVLGKPAEAFFQAAAAELKLAPKAVVMIGDDIRTDIGGAQSAGMSAALVQTGKFRPLDLEGEVKPEAVLASVAELPAWWERNSQ
jgi:HAD superfamily hydrolase (TIGR01458 family)